MKTIFIYGLTCPHTGDIRYVGKTENVDVRFKRHFTQYALSQPSRKAQWIRELVANNLKPGLIVFATVDETFWEDAEKGYIEYYRKIGCDLVNTRLGGKGGLSDEERYRFSKLRVGTKLPQWHIEVLRKANTGRVNSREAIEKTSAAKRGKKRSDETKDKIRLTFENKSPEEKALQLSHLRAPKSDATRAKMSASATGRVMSPERKAKIAESVRKRWAIIKASR